MRVVVINVVAIDKGVIDKRIISLILFFVFEGLYPSGVRIKKEGSYPLNFRSTVNFFIAEIYFTFC